MQVVDATAPCQSEADLRGALAQGPTALRIGVAPGVRRSRAYAAWVANLVEAGVSPVGVLIAVPSSASACEMRARLADLGLADEGACVLTHLEACRLICVGAEGARRPSPGWGNPRVLASVERSLVLDDLKGGGVAVATLRGLMAKMQAGCETAAPVELWGLDGAERCALRLLQDQLDARGAVLSCQMWPRALETARARKAAQEEPFEYVLVDGAQDLSAAAIEALAASARVRSVLVEERVQGPSEGVGPVGGSAGACELHHIKWREPADEVRGVAAMVSGLLSRDSSLLPRDILVVAPGRHLCHEMCQALSARRLGIQRLSRFDAVVGDPRRRERLGTLEAYAALALAAGAADAAAWRLWFALGRADAGRPLWERARRLAAQGASSVAEVLNNLVGGPALGIDAATSELALRVRQGVEVARGLAGKTGFALRSALMRRFPEAGLPELFERVEGDDPAGLLQGMLDQSFVPCFGPAPGAVRVCTLDALPADGERHRFVFVFGLVDALVGDDPPSFDVSAFVSLLAHADDGAYVSYFQRCEAEEAARLCLPVGRTRLYRGRNVGAYERSRLIDELGDALPGSVSAEQYLSENDG